MSGRVGDFQPVNENGNGAYAQKAMHIQRRVRVHFNLAIGGHRHLCHPGFDANACFVEGPGRRPDGALQVQSTRVDGRVHGLLTGQ